MCCHARAGAAGGSDDGGRSLPGGRGGARIRAVLDRLRGTPVKTALFVDPEPDTLRTALDMGADAVELHTGEYANRWRAGRGAPEELTRLRRAAALGRSLGLDVHAGHGLTYENVRPVAAVAEIEELNIGHSVISRSIFVGVERAVAEMRSLLREARATG